MCFKICKIIKQIYCLFKYTYTHTHLLIIFDDVIENIFLILITLLLIITNNNAI